MKKNEFLLLLENRLRALPEAEAQRFLAFYGESIDDRMEDGMSEEEAVAQLGNIDDIVREIELEMPLKTLVRTTVRQQKAKTGHSTLWILLSILGSPLWLPLLLAGGIVALVLFFTLWLVLFVLVVTLGSLFLGGVAALFGIVGSILAGTHSGFFLLGMGLFLVGVTMLLVRPMGWLIRKAAALSMRPVGWIKRKLISKREAI